MNLEIICRLINNKIFNYYKKNDVYYLDCNYKEKDYSFIFNNLWFDNDDDEIFNYLDHKIESNKISYIVAYGYSGSGKTYTLTNFFRNFLYKLNEGNIKFQISGYQIYNEEIYDLFNNEKVKYYMGKTLKVKNLTKINSNDIDYILNKINKNRNTSCNLINDTSSRSHAIIKIRYEGKVCIIVDMAGLEAGNVNKNIKIQKEANNINLNMLAFKECIRSLNNKNNFIPYRRCILTILLKDMFCMKNNIYFICNINCNNNFNYQLDCLKYASSLCTYKNKKPSYYRKILMEYSYYVQNIGLCYSEEHEIWREIKNGKYNKIGYIKNLLKKHSKSIKDFSKKIDSILPPILKN